MLKNFKTVNDKTVIVDAAAVVLLESSVIGGVQITRISLNSGRSVDVAGTPEDTAIVLQGE